MANLKQKKIPLRMCLGCNEMKPKGDLIRVVRDSQGNISLDATGKKNGRGAYVCRDNKCLESAKKSKRLERAFSTAIPEEIYDSLKREMDLLD